MVPQRLPLNPEKLTCASSSVKNKSDRMWVVYKSFYMFFFSNSATTPALKNHRHVGVKEEHLVINKP